ncbi:MAG: PAS domain-containing sensor histidine kinase, partial [Anaerolineae bacterium]|nr:PAS domain-containing sensor histidine kinase [Anaerolineae bacterium]
EQVEAVLNSSSEAIILTKTDGTIRQTNPAFDALFGYQIDETFGVPLAQLIKPDQAGPFMAVFQAVIRGKSTRTLEVTARRKDGTLVDVEVGLSVIVDEDDEASRVVCSFHDISKHKEIEETLRLALEHERELSELTSRFITMVSHEFRTPLATILVTVDSLRSYIDRMTVEQRSSKFVKIQAQIQHMTTLLEEVLELSRDSASEPLALEEVNLDELCQEIISQFRATAPKHDFVYVQVGGQPYLRLDPRLIQQTITALLSNAVKFSPPGREVQIRLDCTGNPIQLQVKDSGIGIPEPDQKHMFQAFHRARNADTIPGTGLSLALVKQAVTRHQGDITFESKVGVGTTFTVTLSRNVSDDQNSFN